MLLLEGDPGFYASLCLSEKKAAGEKENRYSLLSEPSLPELRNGMDLETLYLNPSI